MPAAAAHGSTDEPSSAPPGGRRFAPCGCAPSGRQRPGTRDSGGRTMKWLVTGREAHAYTGGKAFDAALPCVAFIHGAMGDHSVWPPLPSVEALADWSLRVMDAAGVQQATLVGHSMGTLIALEAAARAPERVARMVLIGAAYPMKVSDALLDTARESPLRAIDMVNALSISTLASKPSYPAPGMWLHGSNRALMRNQQALSDGVNLFEHDFRICDAYAGGGPAMAKVRCPTTLITGVRDQMTPPKATRELAAALKAEVVPVTSGHHLMAEAPDAV